MHGGSQVPHCLPGILGQDKAGYSLVIKVPCGDFQIAVLKQVGLRKGCGEKAFPEEELNVIFYNSIDIVKVTAFVRKQIADII